MKTGSKVSTPTHRFAWGGVSFSIPESWELSAFKSAGGSTHIEMEDTVGKRLEAEWLKVPGKFSATGILSRCSKATAKIAKKAKDSRELRGLPPGWTATQYVFAEGHSLATVVNIVPVAKMFFTFLLFFDGSNENELRSSLKILTDSLKIHTEALMPWECYDLNFKLNSAFKLIETTFLSGRKAMVFQCKQRRMYVWLFSLADMALKGRPLAMFAAEFLNTVKGLRGPRFVAKPDGSVATERRALYPLGHADQLGRLCFRYKIGFERIEEKNQIFLWVFHYRRNDDLKMLDGFAFTGKP